MCAIAPTAPTYTLPLQGNVLQGQVRAGRLVPAEILVPKFLNSL